MTLDLSAVFRLWRRMFFSSDRLCAAGVHFEFTMHQRVGQMGGGGLFLSAWGGDRDTPVVSLNISLILRACL